MAPKSLGTKRKSPNDGNAPAGKKACPSTDLVRTGAALLVHSILANPKAYPISASEEAARNSLVELATYARTLEQQISAGPATLPAPPSTSSTIPADQVARPGAKSQAQIKDEAEKIRRAAQSGIIKQMGWKPTCREGRSKWSYDGFCPDPEVFGALLGLGGPPKFRARKFDTEEFQKIIGQLERSVRYATLYITSSQVTVHWSETGEFKFSGLYGKWQTPKQ
ncbi:hypothetical protein BV20DRAFT_964493 [Pilatotrama ljubarskyi]|nr:hypothetical protein BV20DRAFT_964493 [Pilatotrama ljubarskyi]